MKISAAMIVVMSLFVVRNVQAGTINPILLHPTETLRVTFDTLPLTDCFVGPCDVLLVFIPFLSHPPDLAITAKLFDGSDLLGTYTSTTLLPSFTSPTSVFAFDSANIDFTNVVNGTLDGVLDLTVSAPVYVNAYEASEEFEPNTQYFIAVSHATDIGEAQGGYFRKATSATTEVPEPSTWLFLATGLVGLLACNHNLITVPRQLPRDSSLQ